MLLHVALYLQWISLLLLEYKRQNSQSFKKKKKVHSCQPYNKPLKFQLQ